ncbi:MAG: class II aldolase/adducin family protein [Euzebyales bacterium]|nr:class II aldolase/adducin family protein [Euzebyales bacterium]
MSNQNTLADELSLAGRRAVSAGLVIGSGGNLSAREPETGHIVATASGTWLDALEQESYSIVALDGTVIGGGPKPTSELPLHLATYRARPDVNAVIHLHPQYCVLLDAMGRDIRLITTDHAYYVRKVASVPWMPSGSAELAAAAAEVLRDGTNCSVLGHHGCVAVAADVGTAFKRAANLEEASALTFLALQLGDTDTVCPPQYIEGIEALESDGPVGVH